VPAPQLQALSPSALSAWRARATSIYCLDFFWTDGLCGVCTLRYETKVRTAKQGDVSFVTDMHGNPAEFLWNPRWFLTVKLAIQK
jgi:hypothetical protein